MITKLNPLLGAVLSLLVTLGSSQNAAAAQITAPRIVFSGAVTDRKTQRTTYPILAMNGDGSGITQMTLTSGAFPVWTRDQKYIAYHRSTTAESTIYVLEAKGEPKGGRKFPVVQASGSGHDWSPDDKNILFTGSEEAGNGLWLVSVDRSTGAVGTPILLREGLCNAPKFSPDGTKIAFYLSGRVTILDLSTREEITFPWSSVSPVWSPDGSKIAFGGVVCFSSTGLCHYEIVVANSDGSGWSDGKGWEPVTSLKSLSYFPTFSPDGTQLVFCSNVSGSRSLYKTTIGSGTVTLLYLGGEPGANWEY